MELSLQRGAVPVNLDRPRVLFFDHAATWLLIQRFGPNFLPELYTVDTTPGAAEPLKLKSMDALVFYLWAGLQREATTAGETLTLDEVGLFVTPFDYLKIFNSVVIALGGATRTPSQGKAEAPAGPAQASGTATAGDGSATQPQPGPTRVTTSMKRSGSRTHRSAGRPRSSGSPRRVS